MIDRRHSLPRPARAALRMQLVDRGHRQTIAFRLEGSRELTPLHGDADRALRFERDALLSGVDAIATPEAAVGVEHRQWIDLRRFRRLPTRRGEEFECVAH